MNLVDDVNLENRLLERLYIRSKMRLFIRAKIRAIRAISTVQTSKDTHRMLKRFHTSQNVLTIRFFLYKQPVYKQPVLRPLKNVATFEAQKSPVA